MFERLKAETMIRSVCYEPARPCENSQVGQSEQVSEDSMDLDEAIDLLIKNKYLFWVSENHTDSEFSIIRYKVLRGEHRGMIQIHYRSGKVFMIDADAEMMEKILTFPGSVVICPDAAGPLKMNSFVSFLFRET